MSESIEKFCRTCAYYRDLHHGSTIGECKKNPPKKGRFPRISPQDWCGEWAGDNQDEIVYCKDCRFSYIGECRVNTPSGKRGFPHVDPEAGCCGIGERKESEEDRSTDLFRRE